MSALRLWVANTADKDANATHTLLRVGRQRPQHDRAAKKCDEFPSPHGLIPLAQTPSDLSRCANGGRPLILFNQFIRANK